MQTTLYRFAPYFFLTVILLGTVCPILFANDALQTDLPKQELLWPEGAPGAKGDTSNDKPTLTTFLPESSKANGTAVVICPGGGYNSVCYDREGVGTAKWFNSLGIAAFVLDYRHRGRGYGHPAPLQDVQRAIRMVRSKVKELNLATDRIGVFGCSAGGHLATSAGIYFTKGNPTASDPSEQVSSRPDFMILCYPVIAFGEPYTDVDSQHNLLGKEADAKLIKKMSIEKQVTSETPPAFIFSMDQDKEVPSENAVVFYLALRKAKVPAELHVYEKGRHGSGIYFQVDTGVKTWYTQCENWLRDRGLLPTK